MKMVRRWELSVGEHELHEVAIEKERHIPYSGFRKQTIRAYVDGHLVQQA